MENQSISFNQSQSPPDRYSTTGEHSTEWSPYNPVKSVKKSFNAKQNHNLIVSQKSRFSNHSLSQKLPDVPDNFSEFSGPNSTGHVNPYLTTYPSWEEPQIEANLRLKEWSEEFLFGEVTEVIVQYFAESPTTTCWVIQRRDVDQRNAILKNLNFYRTFDSIETVDTIKIDNVYSVQFEGGCHRGIVLYRINSREVWVRLIDNGRSFRTRINAIRAFTQFSANLKGLAFEINFETLRSIAVGDVLRVKNISCNPNGVIEVRIVEDSTIFTDKDIKSVPLPVDVPLELFCLDYSNIHKGYISACENDPTKIESITGISYRIAEYCEKTNGEKNYCPKLNELCLAYAADEGQWYRSKCRETVMPNTFRLEMIDYGVLEEVSSKNIRKMVEEFMEPTIMHRCTIFGEFLIGFFLFNHSTVCNFA